MSQQVQVSSIQSLMRFRAAMIEYQEQVRSALSDVQSDSQRTISWIEQEMIPYWTNQIKKRKEQVELAKQAVNKKKLYESPGGGKQSAVEEEKMLRIAKQRLETAEEKLAACKRWRRQVDRAVVQYQPMIQRLGQTVEQNVPRAVADLERAVVALEKYRQVQVASSEPGGAASEADMSRGSVEEGGAWELDAGALRGRTPGPGERVAGKWIEGGDGEGVGVPGAEELDERLLEVVAGERSKRTQPGSEQWVAIGTAGDEQRWYLHRMGAADEADSGWYVGPAEDEGGEGGDLRRCRVDRLLREAHRLEPLLGLPTGWVVVFERGRVVGVYDGENGLRWPAV